jgi:hypothetical protein
MQTRKHLALRIPENDLDRIDQLAGDRRLTRTEYMIQASTGTLAASGSDPHSGADGHREFAGVGALAGLGGNGAMHSEAD